MRFAITGNDRTLGVFEAFVSAGWKPLKLFTVPAGNVHDSNIAAAAFAEHHHAAIQMSRMTDLDILELQEQGCEALVVASYNWRIENWQRYLKYAVNFHPSPLPIGRGPDPLPRAIQENLGSWGVTCHRLAPEIDAGDILAMEEFPLQPDECHESLTLKVQMASKQLASRVARQFIELWDNATPQGEGSYWPRSKFLDRCVKFDNKVETITRHIRSFGDIESYVNINNAWISVKRTSGWNEQHDKKPGTVVHIYGRTLVIAVQDGYIALLEWDSVHQDIMKVLRKRI